MIVKCSHCNKDVEKNTGHVNRANKLGLKIYCNRKCSGLGRRKNLTDSEKKEIKKKYDKEYRRKNKALIDKKKKEYYEKNKKEIYKRNRKKLDNDEHRKKHAEYCRKPDQRKKEKINRYKRIYGNDWKEQTKFCISCNQDKHIFNFESFPVFPDGRRHICDECETYQNEKYGYSTRLTMTAMVMRRYTNLTREDIAKKPYLIEANKYLIMLKQLVK